jgi:L-2-hydroxyglutarate oxidase
MQRPLVYKMDEMAHPKPVAVIGGGIIGLAAAYKLSRLGLAVAVFEKEPEVGRHQSGRNSGVLHAGLYYKPGSLKARLAVAGIRQMRAFCQAEGIPHEICGKLVVATSPDEVARLRELYARGEANGLRGLRWLDGPQAIAGVEPGVTAGIAAVAVPEEGIVDYPAICVRLAERIRERGGAVHLNAQVTDLKNEGASGWTIKSTQGEFKARFLFNCAGLHCDRILKMAGEIRQSRIVPFRGEYFLLKPEARHLVRHLIYPVPDPKFPFLGVHFTRMIGGGVEAGPNAVLGLKREGYTWRDVDPGDLADVFSFSGFWRFLARYPSMAWYEVRRSLDRQEFCRSLQRLVPAIELDHLTPGGAGVRAQAIAPDGTPVQDFELVVRPNALHVINAPSPGATASLAIADHLLSLTPALTR